MMMWHFGGEGRVRAPAVAGQFYLADPTSLAKAVAGYLATARVQRPRPANLRAVVVPHAGHIYSGEVAASAYQQLQRPGPEPIRRVVLIGPSHFVPVRAVAASSASVWQTPLGEVTLDTEARDLLLAGGLVVVDDDVHRSEHCLEVQLPFLQQVLAGPWSLLPLGIGHVPAEDVAEVLLQILTATDLGISPAETLIVVSTDLSHYQTYEAARKQDRETVAAILKRDSAAISDHDACGAYALRGVLHLADRLGWEPTLLDLRNSGDTAGPRDRVVGYAALDLTGDLPLPARHTAEASERQDEGVDLSPGQRRHLLRLARSTIETALTTGERVVPTASDLPAGLRSPAATFVTLRDRRSGDLLGCIGTMEPYQALGADVADHALGAAFSDPRFPPVTQEVLDETLIDVSVLGPMREFDALGYSDLVQRLPRGSGLLVRDGMHHATYLPSVWQEVPGPEQFVASLWRKAGLRPGHWSADTRVWRYDVTEFSEDTEEISGSAE